MNNLIIQKGQSTLGVNFDCTSGICELSGSSYPENSIRFFEPLVKWIKEFMATGKKPITFNLRLNYINTSSTKSLLDIFTILEKYHMGDGDVKLSWYYPQAEDDMRETGEELVGDINLPVEFLPY